MLEVTAVQDIAFMITICENLHTPSPQNMFSQKAWIFICFQNSPGIKNEGRRGKEAHLDQTEVRHGLPAKAGNRHSAGCQKNDARDHGLWLQPRQKQLSLGTREAAQTLGHARYTVLSES